MQLLITKEGAEPQVIIQDVSMFKNYKCFNKATDPDYTEKSYRICSKSSNLVYFNQNEDKSLDVSRVLTLK